MTLKLLNYLLRNDVPQDFVLNWLKSSEVEKELLEISDDVKISHEQFIINFFNELRSQTQWLLKQDTQVDTSLVKPVSNLTDGSNLEINQTSTPQGAKSFNSSINSIEKLTSTPKSADKRFRPRVKLFTSPQIGVPSTSSTPRETPPSAKSTHSSDGADSIVWPALDVTPPLPNKFKNMNISSENIAVAKPNTPTWHNKSLNDEYHCRSRAKLFLGDFVTKEGNSPKGKGRRIKPTKVASEAVKALPIDGPFACAAVPQSPEENLKNFHVRLDMKKECDLISNLIVVGSPKVKKDEPNFNSPTRITVKNDDKMEEKISPMSTSINTSKSPVAQLAIERSTVKAPDMDLQLVTNATGLELLAKIFSFLLLENLCGNLMIELCFITNLVMAVEPDDKGPVSPPFDKLQNCAYFAVQTLVLLKDLICVFNATTLSLLAATPAVASFGPDLKVLLDDCARDKIKLPSLSHVPQDGNVSFQCDTDNKENFTSHLNFTSFRKQRDSLYQLLQMWEKDHNTPGWNFHAKLSSRVKAILSLREDPTNMVHLARLFRNQLLASCSINSFSLEEEDVFQLIPITDRGRLSRLQARMSGPGAGRGPVPAADFPGRQLFFQEFIRTCGSGSFIHFLKLSLVDELLRLNDQEFTTEGNDCFADELTQKRYLECVSSTRLLAKFLAFAEFLPYQECGDFTEQVIHLHFAIRKRVLPLFDVERCLMDAVTSHRLVLTVPWITSYLSLMDRVSARLPAYSNIWRRLSALRCSLPLHLTQAGRLMLQLCLGWLFQVAPVPDIKPLGLEHLTEERGLDDLKVVSETALYHICPFLTELNRILNGIAASSGRHIRPTPTASKEDHSVAAKQLELRLEESFLQNQSPSTRRTIQFVSERVASCCIKHISADILPQIKTKISNQFVEISSPTENNIIERALAEWEAEVSSTCMTTARNVCQLRVTQSLRALLGRDVEESAVEVAVALAYRQAIEKVQSWIQSHALADSAKTDIKNYLAHRDINQNKKDDSLLRNDDNSQNPSSLTTCINLIRDAVWSAVHGELTDDVFRYAIENIMELVNSHSMPAPTERGIFCLLLELLIWSYISCPNIPIVSWQQLATLLANLNPTQHPLTPLDRLFCTRNMELAQGPEKSWRLIQLPMLLLENKLLTRKSAFDQVKSCLLLDLSQNIRLNLLKVAAALEEFKCED